MVISCNDVAAWMIGLSRLTTDLRFVDQTGSSRNVGRASKWRTRWWSFGC